MCICFDRATPVEQCTMAFIAIVYSGLHTYDETYQGRFTGTDIERCTCYIIKRKSRTI